MRRFSAQLVDKPPQTPHSSTMPLCTAHTDKNSFLPRTSGRLLPQCRFMRWGITPLPSSSSSMLTTPTTQVSQHLQDAECMSLYSSDKGDKGPGYRTLEPWPSTCRLLPQKGHLGSSTWLTAQHAPRASTIPLAQQAPCTSTSFPSPPHTPHASTCTPMYNTGLAHVEPHSENASLFEMWRGM